MTPPRAKTIVAAVWIVSFLICFPPLLQQWKPTPQPTSMSISPVHVISSPGSSFSIQPETAMTMTVATSSMTNKPIDSSDFGEMYSASEIQQIPAKISRERRNTWQRDEPTALDYASTTPAKSHNEPKLEPHIATDNTMRASARGDQTASTIWTSMELIIKQNKSLLNPLLSNDDTERREQHLTDTPILMTTDSDSDSDSDSLLSLLSLPLAEQLRRNERTKLSLDMKTSRKSKRKVSANNGITSKEAPVNGHAVADVDASVGPGTNSRLKNRRRPLIVLLLPEFNNNTKLKASQGVASEPESTLMPQQVTIFSVFLGLAHLHNASEGDAKVSMREREEQPFNRPTVERRKQHQGEEEEEGKLFHTISELFGIEVEGEGKGKEISRERAKIVKFQMEVIRVIDNKLCLVNLVSSRIVEPKVCCITVMLVVGKEEEKTDRKELLERSCRELFAKVEAENINEIISKLLTLPRGELVKVGMAYLDTTDMQTNKQSYDTHRRSSSDSNNNNNNRKIAEKSLKRGLDSAKILIGELSLKQMKHGKDHDGNLGGLAFESGHSGGQGEAIVSKRRNKRRLDIKGSENKEDSRMREGKLKLKREGGAIKGLADFKMQSLMKSSSLLFLLSLFRSGPTQAPVKTTTTDLPTSTSAATKPERPPRSPLINAAGKLVAPTRSLLASLLPLDLNDHDTGTSGGSSGTTKPASSEENILEAIELLTGCTLFPYFSYKEDSLARYQSDNLRNYNYSDNKNNNNYMSSKYYISHDVTIWLRNSTFTTPLWTSKSAKYKEQQQQQQQKQQKLLPWRLREPALLLFPASNHQNLTRAPGSKASLDFFLSIQRLPPIYSHLSWPTTSRSHSDNLFVAATLNELKQRPDIGQVVTTMAPQGATNSQQESNCIETIRVITGSSYSCQLLLLQQSERMEAENGAKEQRLNSIASVSRLALKWWSELVIAVSMLVNFNQELGLLLDPLSPLLPSSPPLTTNLPFGRYRHRFNQSVVESNCQLSSCCNFSISTNSIDLAHFRCFHGCHCFWHQITLPDNDKSALASGLLAIIESNTIGGHAASSRVETSEKTKQHLRQTIIPFFDHYFRNNNHHQQNTMRKGCQMKLRSKLDEVARKFPISLIASCLIANQTNEHFETSLAFYFNTTSTIDYEYIECPKIQCKFHDSKQEAKKILPPKLYDILLVTVATTAADNDHDYDNQNDHDKFSSYINKVDRIKRNTFNDKPAHLKVYGHSEREDKKKRRSKKRGAKQEKAILVSGNSLSDLVARLKSRLSLHKSIDKIKGHSENNLIHPIKYNTLFSSSPLRSASLSLGSGKTKVKRGDEGNNSQEDNYGDNEKINNGTSVGGTSTTKATTNTDFSQFDTNESNINDNNNNSHHNRHSGANSDDWYSIKSTTPTAVNNRRKKSGCALFDDKPYVIYSALGSFYIPMLIMIFFYSRIYLVASRAQKAMRRGYMTTKWPVSGSASSVGGSGRCGEGGKSRMGGAERVTLRIHRREKSPAYVPQPDNEEGVAPANGQHHHQNSNNNNHNQQSILLKLTEIERQKQQQSISSNNLERKVSCEKEQVSSTTKVSGHQSHEDASSIYKPETLIGLVNDKEEVEEGLRGILVVSDEHVVLKGEDEGNFSASVNVTSQENYNETANFGKTKNKQHLAPEEEGRTFRSNNLASSQVETSDADIIEGQKFEDREGIEVGNRVALEPSTSSSSPSSVSSFSSLCHLHSKKNRKGILNESNLICSKEVVLSSFSPSLEANRKSASGNNKMAANEGAISSKQTPLEEEASSSRRCHMCCKRKREKEKEKEKKQVEVAGLKPESLVTKLLDKEEDINNNNSGIINGECRSQRSCSLEQVLEMHRATRRHHHHHQHQHQPNHHHHHHHHHHQQQQHHLHNYHHYQHRHNNHHHCYCNQHHHHHHHHQLAHDNNQSYHHNHNNSNSNSNSSSSRGSNKNRHHNNRRRCCIPSQIEHIRCRHCAGIEKDRTRLVAEVGTNFQALANTKLEDLSSKTISDANELDRLIIHSCIQEEGSNSNVPSGGEDLALTNSSNNTCYPATNITAQIQDKTSLDRRDAECSNDGSLNSVQITVSQYDVCKNDDDVDGESDNVMVNATNQGSIFVSITPPIEGGSSRSERSKSVDVPSVSKQTNQATDLSANLSSEDSSVGRVDRSLSCGPTPTIVVNWNSDTKNAESKLVIANYNKDGTTDHSLVLKRNIASEGTLSFVVEKKDKASEISELGGHAGSQGSGLSIMASIPQAAHQMRKQSKILLSSISTRSSQTLRRLSMVASHPVESLIRRSRSNSGSSSSSGSLDQSNNLSGEENENNMSNNLHQDKHGKEKKRKKRSNTSNMPKRTIDDYLMAVAGVDGSSEDEEEEIEGEEGEQSMGDETLSDDSVNYSLLFNRKKSIVVDNQETGSNNDESESKTYDKLRKSTANDDTEAKQTTIAKLPIEQELEKVEEINFRPPSALHRQGAYYERATSRASAITADIGTNNERKIFKVSNALVGGKPQARGNNNGLVTDAGELVDTNSPLKKPLSIPLALVSNRAQRRRGAKRTSRWHAKRLHAETKAAKTVAIIIGGFIFCWLPFFTAYLSRAIICEKPDCIPQSLLSLFIWLGYLNSAINPVIYGLFSADFRHAFKNILCRCRIRNTDDTVVVSVLVDSIIKSIL